MKLYYSNGSPFARKVRIVLIEKGLSFESDVNDKVRPIDQMPGPTLAIPYLEDGQVQIWDSDLIVDYLLRTYPQNSSSDTTPLSPWLARPEQHWSDMATLSTIAACIESMVNLRFMFADGITPENSDYLMRQKSRFETCLDWLEGRVTEDGFMPGWFSIMDIGFISGMGYCEKRRVMSWRGRRKLEALYERHQNRPSLLATPVNELPIAKPKYMVERRALD